ncbi:type II toxin-antitoxin system YafQ family toxin [Acetobacterium wieringae]|uniref:type II toxin-antitoxin system YafQ family toxin n=1 Tax=Acetobacterium wieringae TaxID=52694 RepID=UPI002B1FE0CC|nr:type II toxin-antitoxin system YafQ family toxin [Acetobacterium wieringae]MEA4805519.1 type II toxin-antitoxin system YafQ family toxin [Acetobacterium wieringae]
MKKYEIVITTRFKKDYKAAIKRGCKQELLEQVIESLINGKALPEKNKDHALIGAWNGYRECHIQPDWLLIYKTKESIRVLLLVRTGTHSELF